MQPLFKPLLLTLLALLPAAANAADVTATQDDASIVLTNEHLRLSVDRKTGQMTSIQSRRGDQWLELAKAGEGLYWDVNFDLLRDPAEPKTRKPRAGYSKASQYLKEVRLAAAGPETAEVVVAAGPSEWFPMTVENHFILHRGQSGFYAYTVLEHGPGMPGGSLAQTRLVIKGVPGHDLYSHHIVDDERLRPKSKSERVEVIQDATDRLADGTVYTKYDNAAYTFRYLAHGMAGREVGLWVLYPSMESLNSGPLRQDLTVHEDNVLLAMWHSSHYGAGKVDLKDDESWRHLYGPVFFYVNSGDSVERMWTDAKVRAYDERAKWPYPWLKHAEYPVERGTVHGSVQVSDGSIPAGAWAVLAPPDGRDWALSAAGYLFWTRVQPDGTFTLPKVRPGRYRLWISGGDQPDDFTLDDVVVKANETSDLGKLTWTPPSFGGKLWQIGRFDRSVVEFRGGEETAHRSYEAFRGYFKAFPDDVTYTIGKSRSNPHWNYAHWAWYNRTPHWTVKFDVAQVPPDANATLTVGLTSRRPAGALQFKVNGTEVAALQMPRSGGAGYRSAAHDSVYTLERIAFPAKLLKPGPNELTIGHTKAEPFPTADGLKTAKRPPGEVMYDALRLDLPGAAKPATTEAEEPAAP